jgi:hypothetical protein
MDDLLKHFDYYSRVARIYPALLCLLPMLLAIALMAIALAKSLAQNAVFIAVGFALLYFAASIARSRGKRVEDAMLAENGGWTSTLMLRHTDGRIDRVTKQRYHRALERLCAGLILPSPAQELGDLAAADNVYRSATKALIEKRREPRWNLLLQENASYGFRRNMLGLKPIAIMLAMLSAIGTGAYWWFLGGMPRSAPAAAALADVWPEPLLLIGLDLLVILAWSLLVNRDWVQRASTEYCVALFRTLDAA